MASAYLSKTSGTTTNNKIGTFSAWIKFSKKTETSSYEPHIFDSYYSSDNRSGLKFEAQKLLFYSRVGASTQVNVSTNRLFRDVSAWYHVVVAIDMTQATSTNRLKMYVNGVQETSMSATTYGSQNDTIHHFLGSVNLAVGRYGGNTSANHMFDGQLTHVHYIDGTAYAASDFGETDTTTGIWKPKTAPSVTYGNNGYFLKMDNAANMGLDSGGGSNNMTTSGTIIQQKDTPSNVFATLNPLSGADTMAVNTTFSNVNNTVVCSGSVYNAFGSTLGVSKGKYYAEFKTNSAPGDGMIGIFAKLGASGNYLGSQTHQYCWYNASGGNIRSNSSNIVTSVGTYTTNDIIGIALDCDNNKLYIHKNGTYISNGSGTGDPTNGTNGISITDPDDTDLGFYFMSAMDWGGSTRGNWSANFGNGFFGTTAVSSAQNPSDGIGIFEYSVPSGYKALCTKSINAQEYS